MGANGSRAVVPKSDGRRGGGSLVAKRLRRHLPTLRHSAICLACRSRAKHGPGPVVGGQIGKRDGFEKRRGSTRCVPMGEEMGRAAAARCLSPSLNLSRTPTCGCEGRETRRIGRREMGAHIRERYVLALHPCISLLPIVSDTSSSIRVVDAVEHVSIDISKSWRAPSTSQVHTHTFASRRANHRPVSPSIRGPAILAPCPVVLYHGNGARGAISSTPRRSHSPPEIPTYVSSSGGLGR